MWLLLQVAISELLAYYYLHTVEEEAFFLVKESIQEMVKNS
jgi:hypothetical protein